MDDWILLAGRLCIGMVFLVSGIHKGIWREKALEEFRQAAIPFPKVLAPCVVLLHLAGSICLIVGAYTQIASILLAVFMILVTMWVHDFWNRSGDEKLISSRDWLANLAILGGLLMIYVAGPGRMALN